MGDAVNGEEDLERVCEGVKRYLLEVWDGMRWDDWRNGKERKVGY